MWKATSSPRALPSSRVPISKESRAAPTIHSRKSRLRAQMARRPPGPIRRVHRAWRLPSRRNSEGPSKGFCVVLLRCLPAARVASSTAICKAFFRGRKRLVRPRWAGLASAGFELEFGAQFPRPHAKFSELLIRAGTLCRHGCDGRTTHRDLASAERGNRPNRPQRTEGTPPARTGHQEGLASAASWPTPVDARS